MASILKSFGSEPVNSFFPLDYTHTSPEGAEVVAQSPCNADTKHKYQVQDGHARNMGSNSLVGSGFRSGWLVGYQREAG